MGMYQQEGDLLCPKASHGTLPAGQALPTQASTTATEIPPKSGMDYIMVDSGAATHVCPTDYALQFRLEECGASTPQIYTVTDDPIKVNGIKKIHYKCNGQHLVIPFYVCDVKSP